MTQWATFAAVTGVVLVLLLVLSYLTQHAFDEPPASPEEAASRIGEDVDDMDGGSESRPNGNINGNGNENGNGDGNENETKIGRDERKPPSSRTNGSGWMETNDGLASDSSREKETSRTSQDDPRAMSTGMLLANVALSQGLFAAVLIAAAVYTQIPAEALGITFDRSYVLTGLALGTAFGVVLYVANELGAAGAKRFGIDHDEELRELLAPDSAGGWAVLLVVVLPIIAVFEEFLFRAALIGALSAGFDVPIWLLAVLSSVVFAVGHGMQGTAGIVVTGVLGFVLAAIFIVTGSFLVVVVAHYLVNALEFVVHEGLGVEWAKSDASETTES